MTDPATRERRLVCTCECHDCCIPQWASCEDCEDNHGD